MAGTASHDTVPPHVRGLRTWLPRCASSPRKDARIVLPPVIYTTTEMMPGDGEDSLDASTFAGAGLRPIAALDACHGTDHGISRIATIEFT